MRPGLKKETTLQDSGDPRSREWGSDTFGRFRYQAEITLPYCLAVVAAQQDIFAVIPEHLEDIALQTVDGWRFLQVKSRDPQRGLWKLSDLLIKKGSALRSLFRTYLCTAGKDYPLELVLEGACKTNDLIHALKPGHDRSLLAPVVADKLGASRSDIDDFLARVVLDESAPPRSAIHATNARLLHEFAPTLNHSELTALHGAFLNEVERAMRSERLGVLWPRSIAHPNRRSTARSEAVRAKTLDRQRLATLVEPVLLVGRPLLRRFVESGARPITALEQKMILGGAPKQLVDRARSLRTNAHHHRYVRASQSLESGSDLLEDLRERLLTYAHTARASSERQARPAIDIWASLLDTFDSGAANIDRNNLVRADPMLLMGEACVLSDECEFDWGDSDDIE